MKAFRIVINPSANVIKNAELSLKSGKMAIIRVPVKTYLAVWSDDSASSNFL